MGKRKEQRVFAFGDGKKRFGVQRFSVVAFKRYVSSGIASSLYLKPSQRSLFSPQETASVQTKKTLEPATTDSVSVPEKGARTTSLLESKPLTVGVSRKSPSADAIAGVKKAAANSINASYVFSFFRSCAATRAFLRRQARFRNRARGTDAHTLDGAARKKDWGNIKNAERSGTGGFRKRRRFPDAQKKTPAFARRSENTGSFFAKTVFWRRSVYPAEKAATPPVYFFSQAASSF